MRTLVPVLMLLAACSDPQDGADSGTVDTSTTTTTTGSGTQTPGCSVWLYTDEFDDDVLDISTYMEFRPWDRLLHLDRHLGDPYGMIIERQDLEYDERGNLIVTRIDPDGTAGYGEYTQTRTYDDQDRQIRLEHDDGDDGVVDWAEDTTWDGEDWVTVQTDFGADGSVEVLWTATYDDDGRYTGKFADDGQDGVIEYQDTLVYLHAAPRLDHNLQVDWEGDSVFDSDTLYLFNDDGYTTYVEVDSDLNGTPEIASSFTYADLDFEALQTVSTTEWFSDGSWRSDYSGTFTYDANALWSELWEEQIVLGDTEPSWWSHSEWDWTCE